ncbi:MAG TPA: cytochrome c peroxidase [Candidatus Methanoperedens sp.]|nr:cytochrome c peroxidase [Candidatus Methanoperedens sp.]
MLKLNKKICLCIAVMFLASVGTMTAAALNDTEQLGKNLFFDTNLSTPPGQACAACHGPEVGYTGPDPKINAHGAVYEGAVNGRFGNRKPPSAAYAGDSPLLHYDSGQGTWIGGMFWDGRATGWTLGDPLAEQAMGPFLNPLEQNNLDAAAVITKVVTGPYNDLYNDVCGSATDKYECIARAIAAYERSSEVSAFTSKYDAVQEGKATFTTKEANGLALFEGKGNCANCHVPPLFTDFTYDNLGVPRNLENPFYNELKYNPMGSAWIDEGLGGFLKSIGYSPNATELGKMKVPTLRNVDKRPNNGFKKAYAHNGYFKSLEEIVHFYNTRDVPGADWNGKPWPSAEVPENVNTAELGNLGLTKQEEKNIVAFLGTLSDGYRSRP